MRHYRRLNWFLCAAVASATSGDAPSLAVTCRHESAHLANSGCPAKSGSRLVGRLVRNRRQNRSDGRSRLVFRLDVGSHLAWRTSHRNGGCVADPSRK